MTLANKLHTELVFNRRVDVLASHLVKHVSAGSSVLDVGCGDGMLNKLICQRGENISAQGIDVLVRGKTHIPVTEFDGHKIPFADDSADVVMFVDVLHHTDNQVELLREAKRVARKSILIKDHTMDGCLAQVTLRFMDWVGNAHHGVALPYNYWPQHKWRNTFQELDLRIESFQQRLSIYPIPASWLFDRRLHFIASLALQ